jgi:transcriptional regulator with AAA-type ATPase domain
LTGSEPFAIVASVRQERALLELRRTPAASNGASFDLSDSQQFSRFIRWIRSSLRGETIYRRVSVTALAEDPRHTIALAVAGLVADFSPSALRSLTNMAESPPGARSARSLSRSGFPALAAARLSSVIRKRPSARTAAAVLWHAVWNSSVGLNRSAEFSALCRQAATALAKSHPAMSAFCTQAPLLTDRPHWRQWGTAYRAAAREVPELARGRLALGVASLWRRSISVPRASRPGRSLGQLLSLAREFGRDALTHQLLIFGRLMRCSNDHTRLRRRIGTALVAFANRGKWEDFAISAGRLAPYLFHRGELPQVNFRLLLERAGKLCGASGTLTKAAALGEEHLRSVGSLERLPHARSRMSQACALEQRLRTLLKRNAFRESLALLNAAAAKDDRDGSQPQMRAAIEGGFRKVRVEGLIAPNDARFGARLTRSRIEREVAELPSQAELLFQAWRSDWLPVAEARNYPLPRSDYLEVSVASLRRIDDESLSRLRELNRQRAHETSWFRRLILGVSCCTMELRVGHTTSAASALAELAPAWRGYRRWLRSVDQPTNHELLVEYERLCAKTLAAMDPPKAPGKCAVGTLVRVARELRPRRRARPDRTIAALDALVTVGRSTVERRFAQRVVREIAAMLGARVLFVRRGKRWLQRRPQSQHTLSGWTVLRLARERRIRTFRVRPRPEFWRPDQHRPGALLVFPIGDGTACVGRQRRFKRRERDAVRAVLRFLDARLAALAAELATTTAVALPPPLPAVAATRQAEGVRDGLVGRSPVWKEVLRQVGLVAETTATVLLVGETGTGKERIARALHAASRRSSREFVAVNCGALSSSLLASELFGHVRGAFTGADRTKEGLLVRAHRGTLFLDEVADMPPEMQVSLLRVLEEREVRPVGGVNAIPVDVRLVAAAGRDLTEEVAVGRFRQDLYHRLDVVRIDLPPLRARRDDIPLLAAHLASRLPEPASIHPDSIAVLLEHSWPGNVRELENVLRACAVLADGVEITPEIVRGVMAQHLRIREAAAGRSLDPRSERVLRTLGSEWLSAPELASRMGVSVRTVNRDVGLLLERGFVDASGEARSRRYARVERER